MKTYITLLITLIALATMTQAAQPTQEYTRTNFNPLYRQSLQPNTPYIYNLTVNPPDGFTQTISAIVTFQAWINPTVEFFLTVNNKTCNTPSFEVHTTYAGAGEGNIFFDCTNVINHSGTYQITLTPDDDTGAISGWLDLTYMNKPIGTAEVFGTDYQVGDNGTTFVQLLDQETPINNATCYTTIYYPDKTIWIDDQLMTHQANSNGFYYYDFVAPDTTGIYMVDVVCNYNTEIKDEYFETLTIIKANNLTSVKNINLSDNNDLIIQETPIRTEYTPTIRYYDNTPIANDTLYHQQRNDAQTITRDFDLKNKRYYLINSSTKIQNGSTLTIRFDPDDAQILYFHNKTTDNSFGTAKIYASYTINASDVAAGYIERNLTLSNINPSGINVIYISDGNQAGTFDAQYDYTSITKQTVSNDSKIEFNVTFPFSQKENIQELYLTVEYELNSEEENITIQIWNYNTTTWDDIGTLMYQVGDLKLSFPINLQNLSSYVNNNRTHFKFNDTLQNDTNTHTLIIDQILLEQVYYLDTPVQVIRGGGELNIRDYEFNLIATIWQKVQDIWDWLTNDLWNINVDINNTVTDIKNDTETIINQLDNLNVTATVNNSDITNFLKSMNQSLTKEISDVKKNVSEIAKQPRLTLP